MRILTLSIMSVLLVSCAAPVVLADTNVSGSVTGVWTQDGSPYLVWGDVWVPADSALFIKPGVWVIFQDNYEFTIDGIIQACGMEDDSIYFTTNSGVTWSGFKFVENPDTSLFYYCLFENADNYPDGYGGVFYLYRSDVFVEHCTFQHNRANRGAAMYALWDHVRFRYNVCWENQVFHCGGAINFGTYEGTVVERCVFYDNSSGPNEGGAMYFWDDHSEVINCTVAQNTSPSVLSINGSTTSFINCIFWYNNLGGVYQATFSDIQGMWPGVGNLNTDPLFVEPTENNFHLLPNSPCIDAGDPDSPLDPDGTLADMGAYYLHQFGPGGNLFLDLDPIDPPIVIPAAGGMFEYIVDVNFTGPPGSIIFDYWAEFLLPNGQIEEGPFFFHPTVNLNQGCSIEREVELYVPATVMPGLYEYRGYCGQWPDTVWAFDSFTFTKLATNGADNSGLDPYLIFTGWDMVEKASLPAGGMAAGNALELKCSPQPFNPETIFSFNLSQKGQAKLEIYNLAGQQVAVLLDRVLEAGVYEHPWNAQGLPSGVYLARLNTPAGSVTQRVLLLK